MEFLLIVLVLSIVGVAFVLLRHRRPSGTRASIDEFERNLEALAPPKDADEARRRGARRSG
jgi:hypothetical protein